MKKICLVLAGLYFNLLAAFSQKTDTLNYKPRKLSLGEVNFISSYYNQDGNNSAVTGGTGTEFLTDYSNSFEVKLIKYNRQNRKVSLDINVGIDYYTSASSDNIDPFTVSSASSRDLRVYPSLLRTVADEEKGFSHSAGISYSHESDYRSYGITGGFSKKSPDNNREFTVKAQVYIDWLKLILPVEMRTPATGGLYGEPNYYDYPWAGRQTYSGSFSLSQVLSQRIQLMLLFDLALQKGYLGLPFHRVYKKDQSLVNEKLPASRFKVPAGIRMNYFAGDKTVIRTFYRFYTDDWGLVSHNADLELAVKTSPFFSVIPFYRFYTQTAIRYFAAYGQHQDNENYYSSNFDLSAFNSHFFGAGFRIAPPKGIFGMKHWYMVEFRFGHYTRSNGLHANIISLHVKYK
jgi:hypothetical protein